MSGGGRLSSELSGYLRFVNVVVRIKGIIEIKSLREINECGESRLWSYLYRPEFINLSLFYIQIMAYTSCMGIR